MQNHYRISKKVVKKFLSSFVLGLPTLLLKSLRRYSINIELSTYYILIAGDPGVISGN